MLHSRNTKEKP